MLVYELTLAYDIGSVRKENIDFEQILDFFKDDNIYVRKQSIELLRTALIPDYCKMQEIANLYKEKVNKLLKYLKSKDTKNALHDQETQGTF